MTKELVEEVARAMHSAFGQVPWDDTFPGVRRNFTKVAEGLILPILARQRNEGIEAAAKVADGLANHWAQEAAKAFPVNPVKYATAAHTERQFIAASTAIRALKEPE